MSFISMNTMEKHIYASNASAKRMRLSAQNAYCKKQASKFMPIKRLVLGREQAEFTIIPY